MSEPVLKIQNLNVNYDKTPALWDVTFEVPANKLVAIIGPNGAGKSTLIKACLGLIQPLSGHVSFFGKELKQVRKQIAYIPQRESVDWDFPITVFELVLMGRYGQLGLCRRPSKQDREIAREALVQVGMEAFASRQISQLSGGQQQRVFIARSLCQGADLYFMDEPFSGIDSVSCQVVVELLQKMQKQGKSIFVVHHDLSTVPSLYDWVVMLNMRMVAGGPTCETFTPEKIALAYGREDLLLGQAVRLTREKREGR